MPKQWMPIIFFKSFHTYEPQSPTLGSLATTWTEPRAWLDPLLLWNL